MSPPIKPGYHRLSFTSYISPLNKDKTIVELIKKSEENSAQSSSKEDITDIDSRSISERCEKILSENKPRVVQKLNRAIFRTQVNSLADQETLKNSKIPFQKLISLASKKTEPKQSEPSTEKVNNLKKSFNPIDAKFWKLVIKIFNFFGMKTNFEFDYSVSKYNEKNSVSKKAAEDKTNSSLDIPVPNDRQEISMKVSESKTIITGTDLNTDPVESISGLVKNVIDNCNIKKLKFNDVLKHFENLLVLADQKKLNSDEINAISKKLKEAFFYNRADDVQIKTGYRDEIIGRKYLHALQRLTGEPISKSGAINNGTLCYLNSTFDVLLFSLASNLDNSVKSLQMNLDYIENIITKEGDLDEKLKKDKIAIKELLNLTLKSSRNEDVSQNEKSKCIELLYKSFFNEPGQQDSFEVMSKIITDMSRYVNDIDRNIYMESLILKAFHSINEFGYVTSNNQVYVGLSANLIGRDEKTGYYQRNFKNMMEAHFAPSLIDDNENHTTNMNLILDKDGNFPKGYMHHVQATKFDFQTGEMKKVLFDSTGVIEPFKANLKVFNPKIQDYENMELLFTPKFEVKHTGSKNGGHYINIQYVAGDDGMVFVLHNDTQVTIHKDYPTPTKKYSGGKEREDSSDPYLIYFETTVLSRSSSL